MENDRQEVEDSHGVLTQKRHGHNDEIAWRECSSAKSVIFLYEYSFFITVVYFLSLWLRQIENTLQSPQQDITNFKLF